MVAAGRLLLACKGYIVSFFLKTSFFQQIQSFNCRIMAFNSQKIRLHRRALRPPNECRLACQKQIAVEVEKAALGSWALPPAG
jgi:hypothetical protein